MRSTRIVLLMATVLCAAGCSSTDERTVSRDDAVVPAATPVVASLPVVTAPPAVVEPPVVEPPTGTLADAVALRKEGRTEEAERLLVSLHEQHPDDVRTLVNLARVRMDRQDADGALEAADSALRQAPDSVDALHQKGRALVARNEGAEALAVLERAHQLDPDDGHVANTLGWLHLLRGENAEAVGPLERARELLPTTAYVRNNLGVVYERLGRLDEAAEEYRAAIGAGDSGKASQGLARIERGQRGPAETLAETLPEK